MWKKWVLVALNKEKVLVCSGLLLRLLWMINVKIGERYPGHDTLSLRLRRCCMLAVYLYAGRAAAHSLSPTWAREHSASKPYLKYEDLSWTGHNAETFLLSFHMLHTHNRHNVYFPHSTLKSVDIYTHSRPSPRVHCHSPRPLQAAACCLSNMIIQAGSL